MVAASTPAPSATSPSPSPSASANVPFANITYPAAGTQVPRRHGVVVGGTVQDPGPYTIWILDHPAHGVYYVDLKATVTRAGSWAAYDHPLGDASDRLPYKITVLAVLADPDCAGQLNQDGATPATSKITDLPEGCHQFRRVTVNVTRP